jgi:hypothetical protein
MREDMFLSAQSTAEAAWRRSIRPFATSRTIDCASGPHSTEAGKQLQVGSDTRNQRRTNQQGFA